jgi:glycosyltransferase involved in cell wall biosynthesis
MQAATRPIRCAVITNVPAPYRLPTWDLLAASGHVELHMVYCAGAHIDPSQDGRSSRYQVHFLKGRYDIHDTRFSHADPDVWRLLGSIQPDVVVTSGFIPTFLFAFVWAVMHRVPHVTMTDGTLESERSLSWKHRLVRRFVFSRTQSFVGACQGSTDLYLSYGLPRERIHVAALCTDNARFASVQVPRSYDLLFSGRFVAHKNPLFAIAVAYQAARRLGRRLSLRFVGKGDMEPAMRQMAQEVSEWVDVSFAGYLSQAELPLEYAASRVFLFPTSFDCWGVVANEACAAGVPCVVTPHTGVVDELIQDGVTGFVCPLDEAMWVDRVVQLLSDDSLWQSMSLAARREVERFTFAHAAQGLLTALQQAVDREVA